MSREKSKVKVIQGKSTCKLVSTYENFTSYTALIPFFNRVYRMCAILQCDWLYPACQWTQCDNGCVAERNSCPVKLQVSGSLLPLALLRGVQLPLGTLSKPMDVWTGGSEQFLHLLA